LIWYDVSIIINIKSSLKYNCNFNEEQNFKEGKWLIMNKKSSILLSVLIIFQILLSNIAMPVFAEDLVAYTEPESPSEVYNMNLDWKYKKPSTTFPLASAMTSVKSGDKEFFAVDYDDSSWETVSVPHQVNAHDTFTKKANNAGDTGQFRGIVFYRKHFTVPSSAAGKKIFVEFEGMCNAAYVWVNGQKVGYYEAAVNAFGFDLTKYVTPGQEAVIAVANDSTSGRGMNNYYKETKPDTEWGSNTGVGYQWTSHEFMPTQAGLIYNVNLYVKDTIYQTLPLYSNLKTTGTYIYGSDFDIRNKKAKINVKAEVRNETAKDEVITLQVDVVKNVDPNEDNPADEDHTKIPVLKYSFTGTGTATKATDAGTAFETVVKPDAYAEDAVHEFLTDVDTVDVSYIEASFDAENLDFWSTESPYLYDVYTILKNSKGEVIDVVKTTTGFRKVSYSIQDGFKLNDKSVWLSGYAQRSVNAWGAIGAANDWLTDYDMSLLRESGGNFVRWMHNAPRPNSVRSTDKYGIVVVAPAGDKETDVNGRSWSQRVEAMRGTMISFRNNPSVIFWEAGNNAISAEHQQEMTELKAKIDPDGGRYSGCRALQSQDQITATEYVGTMLNRHVAGAFESMKALNKFVPVIEVEYHREEAPRRVWDDYSPPDYDYDNLYANGTAIAGYDAHDYTSESFVVNDAKSYQEFYQDRVNGSSGKNYYAGAGALCWSDSNELGRQTYTENTRSSGRVDTIRIPKQSFYAYQVMQSTTPKVHVVGHWNYEQVNNLPQGAGGNYYFAEKVLKDGIWQKTGTYGRRDPHKKTVYVVGTSAYISKVQLYVDGELKGTATTPINTFIYEFPNIDVTKGDTVEAIALDSMGNEIARHEIKRAGEPATIRLTPSTGAEGFLADGSDLMYFDVEVIDANGNVCPLSYDRIDFELTGDAKFMGGYNSGKYDDTSVIGKNYVYAECGVNRVFVKAGKNAGKITLKATMAGGSMAPVTESVDMIAYPAAITGGLTTHKQQELDFGAIKKTIEKTVSAMMPLTKSASVLSSAFNSDNSFLYIKKPIVETKDVYDVSLNGVKIPLINEAYATNDMTKAVICETETVLAAIKALGADFTYEKNMDAEKPYIKMFSKKGQQGIDGTIHEYVIMKGQTAIGYDGDPEGMLTNAEFYVENGELMMEIAALVPFIDGVSAYKNEETKTLEITYAAH
jgi:beta-galactosidase